MVLIHLEAETYKDYLYVFDRVLYELCGYNDEQSRLKQELGTKQLLLESLINPSAISQRLGELNTDN